MFLAESTFFWSSVCISRPLYLSASLATYVRLSLESVCLLGALQRYLENFMLNRPWQQTGGCHAGGDITEGGRALGSGPCMARWSVTDRAFQHYLHRVFLSQFFYFWIPFHSKWKQLDNKVRLCSIGTTTLLWKTLTKPLFFFFNTTYVREILSCIILVRNQMSACLCPSYLLIYFGR